MDDEAFKKLKKKLDDAVGKRMDDFCSSTLANDHSENQCAHFVSHMLGYDLPKSASCKTWTWDDKHNNAVVGASIRVNEIYNSVPKIRKMSISAKACYFSGLVFVTTRGNMGVNGRMGSKAKHIGILLGQWVYHYGNSTDKVKKERLETFIKVFTRTVPYRSNPPVVFFRSEFLE